MSDFQASFQTFKEALIYYYQNPLEAYEGCARKLSEWRYNPEFFQKICQVAAAALLLKITRDPHPSPLSKLSHVFSTVNMHGLLNFFKKPRDFFFPITLQRIDEYALLNALTLVLCDHFGASYETDPSGNVIAVEDDNIVIFARAGLEKQFSVMLETGDAYRSAEEFKTVLQNRLRALTEIHRDDHGIDRSYDFTTLELSQLQIPLTSSSFIAKLESTDWLLVDCGCLLLYLRGWGLIDTAKWADSMGSYKVFGWVKHQLLEGWVRTAVCCGISLRLCEATRELWSVALTDQERRKARWRVVGSLFALAANGAGLLNCIGRRVINDRSYLFLTIVSHGIGLVEIMTRPKHQFFEEKKV